VPRRVLYGTAARRTCRPPSRTNNAGASGEDKFQRQRASLRVLKLFRMSCRSAHRFHIASRIIHLPASSSSPRPLSPRQSFLPLFLIHMHAFHGIIFALLRRSDCGWGRSTHTRTLARTARRNRSRSRWRFNGRADRSRAERQLIMAFMAYSVRILPIIFYRLPLPPLQFRF
jgi:hypothetical protein